MIFEIFRKEFFHQICFTPNQVYTWHPGFDKNNLGRWVKNGYLIKLKNGFYIFSEWQDTPNIHLYIANRMYRPSYISLHTALAFHGLIPEAITAVTSVSTRKTVRFENALGSFSYKKLKNNLFFGYAHLPFTEGRTVLLATPEKALLDLLYFYPFYNTENELINLRLDEDVLAGLINKDQFLKFLVRFESKALNRRAHLLLKSYVL
ncbi:MAG TPA: hypothetical protein ENI57_09285 [Ignavibacteria bacterium]|nr:hypothetical protein [Ignavibacteria bacterium]